MDAKMGMRGGAKAWSVLYDGKRWDCSGSCVFSGRSRVVWWNAEGSCVRECECVFHGLGIDCL